MKASSGKAEERDRLGIAMVYPRLHRWGGVERYVWEVSARLAEWYDVTIVTALTEGPVPEGVEIRKLRIPRRPKFIQGPTFAAAASLHLRRHRFDFVIAQGASCLRQDLVVAHSCHRAWYEESLAALPLASGRRWRKFLNPLHHLTLAIERIQYGAAERPTVVAVSRGVKEELRRWYELPDRDIAVIYNGVDSSAFHPRNRDLAGREVRKGWGFDENDTVLLFVSNEFERKGLRSVIEVLPRLDERVHLLVVGEGSITPFRQLAAAVGVEGQVHFAGSVKEPAAHYGAADVFVLPTTYEPFGLVVLEAMATGVPVIVSAQAGIAELLKDGEDGILLSNPDDPNELAAAVSRLRDPQTHGALGVAGRETARSYSWDRVARRTMQLVDRAVAGPRRESEQGVPSR